MAFPGPLSFPLGGSNPWVGRYAEAVVSLLPPGRGVSKEPSANITALMAAIGIEPSRLHARARELLVEMIPMRAYELIDEWFAELRVSREGVTTLEDKRRAIGARLLRLENHGIDEMERLADVFGAGGITVEHYSPFVAGSTAGDALTNDPWAHHIEVTAPHTDFDGAFEVAFRDRLRTHATANFTFV